ncbi:MAG TPA: homocysteine S-methyltransferase [candidate division Zixibacteria bacterium]|nr:homocysteine S-methyltransferase [candidate division Zixibacteria bacterium]
MSSPNPFTPFLNRSSPIILDGGLATELEARGYSLSDRLWSARLLVDAPEAIQEVHYDYLVAGADCIISASYQGTIEGFMSRDLSKDEAIDLLELSIDLAIEARDRFWADPSNRIDRVKPIVAASVGPYGAFLADGSEFTGDYDLDEIGLLEFHRERWQILSSTDADILACETIPSLVEARALGQLAEQDADRPLWISFSCKDGSRISDGTLLADVLCILEPIENIIAVGINCTAPGHVPSLIAEAKTATQKLIVVYPNSGEEYDPVHRQWTGDSDAITYAAASREWQTAGASLIGGCCRTGPEHINLLRQELISEA